MRLSPMRQTTTHSCNSEFSLRDFFHFRLGGLRYHFAFDRKHSLQWYGGGGGGGKKRWAKALTHINLSIPKSFPKVQRL